MPAPPEPVPSLGPVVFSVRFNGIERQVDLSGLPCPRLVRPLARTLTELGGEDSSLGSWEAFRRFVTDVRTFVTFVARVESDRADQFDLDDLEPALLDAFEATLIQDHGQGSDQPYLVLLNVVRMLRLVREAQPDVFDAAMSARIGFATATTLSRKPAPVDAYPLPVFDAVHAAALRDVGRARDRILGGERLAALGENPEVAGWHKLKNALWHVREHGPLTASHPRYATIKDRLGGVRAVNAHLFLTASDVVAFLVLAICQTGLEPECVKSLRADCLINPARGYVSVSYLKKRARGDSRKTLRIADGGALHFPGGVLRLALRLTQRGRDMMGTDALWVEAGDDGPRESFRHRRDITPQTRAWLRHHGVDELEDADRSPVRLDLRRLRKSYKSQQYVRAAGILPDFTVGHTREVAAAHYADIDAHRERHDRAVEDGLREALDAALAPPVVLDADGQRLDTGRDLLAPEQVHAALSEHNDVWLASCTDFFASPFALKKGTGCPVAIWGCVECPNAVFTARHLPSILSFLDFLERQREEFSAAEWQARYGLAWQRIVEGIRPKFSDSQLATAQAIAEAAGPHLSLPAQIMESIA